MEGRFPEFPSVLVFTKAKPFFIFNLYTFASESVGEGCEGVRMP